MNEDTFLMLQEIETEILLHCTLESGALWHALALHDRLAFLIQILRGHLHTPDIHVHLSFMIRNHIFDNIPYPDNLPLPAP